MSCGPQAQSSGSPNGLPVGDGVGFPASLRRLGAWAMEAPYGAACDGQKRPPIRAVDPLAERLFIGLLKKKNPPESPMMDDGKQPYKGRLSSGRSVGLWWLAHEERRRRIREGGGARAWAFLGWGVSDPGRVF